MAIKKLQNNYTTPEQSKKLLKLGVPADSADCYYNTIAEKPYFLTMPYLYCNWIDKRNPPLPCWSVGRLIEIITICCNHYSGNNDIVFNQAAVNHGIIECLVAYLVIAKKDVSLDFSKLEG